MKRIAYYLRWLADRLDPPMNPSPIVARAKVLCDLMDQRFQPGFGQAKRRDVYAALKDEFGDVSHRVLSLAIEQALNGD